MNTFIVWVVLETERPNRTSHLLFWSKGLTIISKSCVVSCPTLYSHLKLLPKRSEHPFDSTSMISTATHMKTSSALDLSTKSDDSNSSSMDLSIGNDKMGESWYGMIVYSINDSILSEIHFNCSLYSKPSNSGIEYRETSPLAEPLDFSAGTHSQPPQQSHLSLCVKNDSMSPSAQLPQHSPHSLSLLTPLSPNSANNNSILSHNYQPIRSPTSEEASSVRSYNCTEDYSDCERGGPPNKMMRSSLNSRVRDGRELLQCPTIGCDGMGHISGNYATHRRYVQSIRKPYDWVLMRSNVRTVCPVVPTPTGL